MAVAYVRVMLKRLAARAGIDKRVHAHGLRHTHAAQLRAEGVDIAIISRQLGHSSITTTARCLLLPTTPDSIPSGRRQPFMGLPRPHRANSRHRSDAPSKLDGCVNSRCSHAVPHGTTCGPGVVGVRAVVQ